MTKRQNNITDVETKWHERGFTDKYHYIGWLQFNDLVDESLCYDDTYYDHYSGITIRIGTEEVVDEEDMWLSGVEENKNV